MKKERILRRAIVETVLAIVLLIPTLKAQDIYVTVDGNGGGNAVIGEYTTSGATVNAALISGLGYPGAPSVDGVAVSGNDLFVVNEGVGQGTGTVGEYTTSGATIATTLISGLDVPSSIAISGNDLFVENAANGTVGEYTISGATVSPSLISGLGQGAYGIAISPIPEPSVGVLAGASAATLWVWRRRK
jgi:hypothetical protein